MNVEIRTEARNSFSGNMRFEFSVLCLRSAAAKAKSNFQTKVPNLLVLLKSLFIVDKAVKRRCWLWECRLYLFDSGTGFRCFQQLTCNNLYTKLTTHKMTYTRRLFVFGCSFRLAGLAHLVLMFFLPDRLRLCFALLTKTLFWTSH